MEPEDKGSDPPLQTGANRREYIRVPAECPVLFRIVDPLVPKRNSKKSIHPIPSLPPFDLTKTKGTEEGVNPQIIELILWLDWKMNYLFKTLTKSQDAEVFPYQAVIMDLSASGMRFSTAKEVKAKTILEFEFILPILPFREMSLVGEVVRCVRSQKEELSGEFEVAAEFKRMKEPDREHIIRYVVKRQLQLQREERSLR
jgi:hypothetical protein